MAEKVNPKRTYRSPRRARQAGETRAAILEAARSSFVTKGWKQSTIASIARKAGVSAETVYTVFGSKKAILEELISGAVRGARPDTPLMQQAGPAAVKAETDPEKRIALFAKDISGILERVAPLMGVVRAASEADPEVVPLYESLHAGRRKNMTEFARWLVDTAALRADLNLEAAADNVWRLTSPELYLLSTGMGGSTGKQYAEWLERTLVALLLPARPGPHTRSGEAGVDQ